MRVLDKARLRLRSLVRRDSCEAELDAELRFHLDQLTEENQARGMSFEEAQREARRQMGSAAHFEEECRDMRGVNAIEDFLRDARHAVRVLRRSPGFTAVAVLTLALAIGANTAVFSVVKSVLMEPLAYRDADRIVMVQTLWTKTNRPGNISGGDYFDVVAEPSPFAAATRYNGGEMPVESPGGAEFAAVYGVDAGFTDVFQVWPAAGRLIAPEEFRTKTPLAMVSAEFAARHFGEAPRALGQTVRIEEKAYAIAGVLPAGFHFPPKADVWLPMPWENNNRTAGNYRAVARLKPGVTVEAARAHLAGAGARLQAAFADTHKDKSFTATPVKDALVRRSSTTLWMLMGAAGLVLLVACANVANLLLARGTSRGREMALRAALGAARHRLVRQLLAESVVLGLAGGAIGLALAYEGVAVLVGMAPPNLPRLDEIRLDGAVLGFNAAVSLGGVVLFGLWPALRAARFDLHDALKQGGRRGVGGGGRGEWVRGALVSAEVALALVLTLGAGLLLRSLWALNGVDAGYRTEGRVVLTASIPAQTKEQHLQAGAEFERIFVALRALPGVSAAAGVMGLPNGPYGSDGLYSVEGMHEHSPNAALPHAGFRLTSPGYFAAMGVPMKEGRDFTERDLYEAEPVAIVSAALVRQVFGGQSPVGRRVRCGLDRDEWMRIVGVAGDMRNDGPAVPPGPELYMPYRQHPYHANDLHIVVRAKGEIAAAARAAIAAIDPRIPLKVSTLEQFQRDAVALPRFRTFLLAVFAAIAAALATAGVYGVMSYAAVERQGEVGVRMALGATAGNVVAMLVGSGARLAAIGVACGLAIAFPAGRLIETMLYGIKPLDPLTVAGAVMLLGAAALAAALVPALRAARLDPLRALRQE